MIVHQKWITRSDLRNNPDSLYVFGDNIRRVGYGGQAKEMRGEPNAFGIATKVSPSLDFTDADYLLVVVYWNWQFEELLNEARSEKYKRVVWPADGIGTGLSRISKTAPLLAKRLNDNIALFMRAVGAPGKRNASSD